MDHSSDGNTDFFEIVAGDLQGDILVLCRFITWLDFTYYES